MSKNTEINPNETNRLQRQHELLKLLEDVTICNGTQNELCAKLDNFCKDNAIAIFDVNTGEDKSLSANTLKKDLHDLQLKQKVKKIGSHYYNKHKYEISELAFKEYYKEINEKDEAKFKIELNKAYCNLQLSIWELRKFQNIENIQEVVSDIYQDCYIECTEKALYIYHPSSKIFDEKTFERTLEIIEKKSEYYWLSLSKEKTKINTKIED